MTTAIRMMTVMRESGAAEMCVFRKSPLKGHKTTPVSRLEALEVVFAVINWGIADVCYQMLHNLLEVDAFVMARDTASYADRFNGFEIVEIG